MIVHITRTGGGVMHLGRVAVIRDWGPQIEVVRAGESPAIFKPDEIASIRIDPEGRICSAGEPEPPLAA